MQRGSDGALDQASDLPLDAPSCFRTGALQDVIRISFGSPPAEYSLAQLLPQRFGPADLLDDAATPLLLQPQRNGVRLAGVSGAKAGASFPSSNGGEGVVAAQPQPPKGAVDAALRAANEVASHTCT